MKTPITLAAAAVAALAAPFAANADVNLPRLFSDNCVLQASSPIPVYGNADPGEKITVKFRAQLVHTTANDAGAWRINLKPEAASETPETLTVSGAKNSATVHGVLVGEVWICSGQSNMEFGLSGAENAKVDIAASADPGLRMFTVPRRTAATPQFDRNGGACVR